VGGGCGPTPQSMNSLTTGVLSRGFMIVIFSESKYDAAVAGARTTRQNGWSALPIVPPNRATHYFFFGLSVIDRPLAAAVTER